MTESPPSKPVPAADQVQLAVQRNLLACERTMMAWNRTAVSMITFGFTLYKFFHAYHTQNPAVREHSLLEARTFSLLIMGIGVFFLVLATWQHHQQIRRLRAVYADAHVALSLGLAGLVAALGTLAFMAALFRI
jgi:putative membrane protein